jgi:hypothetical protein
MEFREWLEIIEYRIFELLFCKLTSALRYLSVNEKEILFVEACISGHFFFIPLLLEMISPEYF